MAYSETFYKPMGYYGPNKQDYQTQTTKNKHLMDALRHALDGVGILITTERNFRRHLFFSSLVVVMGVVCSLSVIEWAVCCLLIVFVLLLETLNSIIETMVDLIVDYQYHPLAKQIKDMSAAAVLLMAMGALVIGVMIFLPKLIALW